MSSFQLAKYARKKKFFFLCTLKLSVLQWDHSNRSKHCFPNSFRSASLFVAESCYDGKFQPWLGLNIQSIFRFVTHNNSNPYPIDIDRSLLLNIFFIVIGVVLRNAFHVTSDNQIIPIWSDQIKNEKSYFNASSVHVTPTFLLLNKWSLKTLLMIVQFIFHIYGLQTRIQTISNFSILF